MSNSPLTDLAEALAAAIAAADIGTYRGDDTAYQAGETAIVMGVLPQTPDRGIAINIVPMTNAVVTGDATVKVQFGVRGEPGDAIDALSIADQLFTLFQDRQNTVYGVYVNQMLRTASVPLDKDDSERYLRSEEYDVYLDYDDVTADYADVLDGGAL